MSNPQPPDFANGIPGNSSAFAPEVWNDVQPSQNETISRNDMVYTSTVEYKGYYKAQSTGFHKFQLSGGADAFAWVSSANSASDHIDVEDDVELVNDLSFGVRIPANPQPGQYWVFQDTGSNGALGGSFPGFGYWPLEGYGTKFVSYFSGRGLSYNHGGTFFPGDIRTYNSTSNTSYGNCQTFCQGSKAGPGWNNPEDPNFNTQDLYYPCDTDWNNSNSCLREGRGAQVYLSEAYVAGGSGKRGLWEQVEGDQPFIVWPVTQTMSQNSLQKPERVQVYWTLKFKRAGNFKLRITTRYGAKFWFTTTPSIKSDGTGGPATIRKLQPVTGLGVNPIPSGGGQFTAPLFFSSADKRIFLVGSATGNQATGDIGLGLEVLDADNNDEVIWDTSKITINETGLVGISECGYHALLPDDQRVPTNGISEFYNADGWLGYDQQLKFVADTEVGDNDQRSERDTRQYLWENVTSLLYDTQSRPGFVYLKADDYYFIRVLVTNRKNGSGQGFSFQVVDPGSNAQNEVVFSGNGDPNADSTVGGGVGGSGIPISKDALCNSVLYASNVPNTSTTFGVITQTNSVLNLTNLGVPENLLGTEGQSESVPEQDPDVNNPGTDGISSFPVQFDNITIKLAVLLQGGENGIPAMTPAEKSAVRAKAATQRSQNLTLSFGEFRNAITSQAVIAYGSSGNYKYLYHAVGEVVRSICDDDFTLEAPEFSGSGRDLTTNNNLLSNGGDCVDFNIQGAIENAGYLSLSSSCVEECKPYDQYDIPSNMQAGVAPKTRYIETLPKYQESTGRDSEDVFFSQFRNNGQQFYEVDVTEGGDGKIMSWGFFVPDVLPSLTKEEYDERNLRTFNGKFFMSSNSYFKFPEGAEYEGAYGPWIFTWLSLTPGGAPIGGREGVNQYVSSGITGRGMDQYISMEPITQTDEINTSRVLYAGNTYGKRYFNFAMIKYENIVNNINLFYGDAGVYKPQEDRIYPGEDGFADMISAAYFQTQQYSLSLSPPKQKCTETTTQNRSSSGNYPEPHDGSGLPSYVDYDPNDDFLSGRTGFGIDGVSTFRSLGKVYFEPCTVRSIPFLIVPGQTNATIVGVPRQNGGIDSNGSLTGLSCPGSTLNDEGLKSDGANYQPNRHTFGWFSRNPGEWDPDTIKLFQAGGEIEFVTRWKQSGNYSLMGVDITEPTWLYMNWAGFDYSLANNNPVSSSNPFEKVIVPDFNNLWPYRGFYWVKTQK